MAYGDVQSLRASTAHTANGTGTLAFAVSGDREARQLSVSLNVSAVLGTSPTLALSVQWSNDGVTWFDGEIPDAFASITATKKVVKSFAIQGAFARLSWVVGGTTPSFTFDASGYSV